MHITCRKYSRYYIYIYIRRTLLHLSWFKINKRIFSSFGLTVAEYRGILKYHVLHTYIVDFITVINRKIIINY